MDIIYLLTFILLAMFALWNILSYTKAKSMQGRPAPDTRDIEGDNFCANKVIFFHSTGCAPCKAMMPLIEKLEQEYSNLYPLEVSQHSALARQFRLAGTPSFFAIKDDIITQVKLGRVNEDWLRNNLET